MLERAAACIKSGAARDSLRCTSNASRSKRMLHSTFWNHGAGALDLPSWATYTLPKPSDLPLKDDSDGLSGTRSQTGAREAVASEGVFLDFLYPPQALAWLQRASAQQQQFQRWEKRNMKRLPEGFVVPSRGYASASRGHQRTSKGQRDAVEQDNQAVHDSESTYEPFGRSSKDVLEQAAPLENYISSGEQEWLPDSEHQHRREMPGENDNAFAMSPGDLAEAIPNSLISLRNLLMFNRGAALEDQDRSRTLTERAWNMYQTLDDESRDDVKLKRELLEWLALRSDDLAVSHCEELYHSIPTGAKTIEIYSSMVSMYLKLEKYDFASYVHYEALQTLENGHLVSKRLLEHAIEHGIWHVAIQTAAQHRSRYNELKQPNQIRLLWLHVSEISGLPKRALHLFRYLGRSEGIGIVDSDSHEFGLKLVKEGVTQLLVAARDHTNRDWPKHFRQSRDREDLVSMIKLAQETTESPTSLIEEAMLAFLNLKQPEYPKYHKMVSTLYREFRKHTGMRPPRPLLELFIWQLSYLEPHRNINEASEDNVIARDIMHDWKLFHRRPSKEAYLRLIRSSAYAGRIDEHEAWMHEFRSLYPDYQDWKDSLWTTIYLYAKRTNLDAAQQAFATISRVMSEHNDEPDLKCWSVLLYAHGRADDLDGAFTNFQSLTKKLQPTEICFLPIFAMLAKRGDVEGLEDFMEQFDEIVGTKHSSFMTTHVINAHINHGNVEEAESLLKQAIPKIKAGEIIGSMTPCFNAMLRAYARRRNIDAAMDTYHWMKREEARFDHDSFAAIMMVLANFRRHGDALKILRVDMPEHRVKPTAFHYAIVMKRLVQNFDYATALKIHDEMREQNIRPSVSTNSLYLAAQANHEGQVLGRTNKVSASGDQPVPLESSIEVLEETLGRYDGEEVAVQQWDFLAGVPDNTAADPGPYFETLIQVHGKRGCFEAVKALFARYREAAKGRGGDESKLPLNLTSSLMSVHWHAGEYDQVEEYWKLAKDRADEISPPVHVPSFRYLITEKSIESADPLKLRPLDDNYADAEAEDSQSSPAVSEQGTQTLLTDKHATMKIRPAPRRRHILNQPLRWYLAALASQSRVIDAISTVSRLLVQGYTLDKHTWNTFICYLLDTTPPLALIAFTLTERFLTPGFPGWVSRHRRKFGNRRNVRYEGLEYINAGHIEPSRLMPQYKTLVRLAAAFLDVRRHEAQGRGRKSNVPPELQKFIGTTREIRRLAAKTLYVVQTMPYVIGDKSQEKYLRRTID